MNDIYRDFPFSEEGKKLNLSDDLFEKCKLVYKKNCETGKWEYDGMWDGSKITDLKKMVVPVQSVYGGYVWVDLGTNFVNVIGSTYDPKPLLQSSWMDLIRLVYRSHNLDSSNTGMITTCCSDGYIYRDRNTFENCPCKNNLDLVGGHILFCQPSQNIAYPNTTVYLLPICRKHNTVDGRVYYMKTNKQLYAIQLDHFLQDDYISRVKKWCETNGIPFPPPFPIN